MSQININADTQTIELTTSSQTVSVSQPPVNTVSVSSDQSLIVNGDQQTIELTGPESTTVTVSQPTNAIISIAAVGLQGPRGPSPDLETFTYDGVTYLEEVDGAHVPHRDHQTYTSVRTLEDMPLNSKITAVFPSRNSVFGDILISDASLLFVGQEFYLNSTEDVLNRDNDGNLPAGTTIYTLDEPPYSEGMITGIATSPSLANNNAALNQYIILIAGTGVVAKTLRERAQGKVEVLPDRHGRVVFDLTLPSTLNNQPVATDGNSYILHESAEGELNWLTLDQEDESTVGNDAFERLISRGRTISFEFAGIELRGSLNQAISASHFHGDFMGQIKTVIDIPQNFAVIGDFILILFNTGYVIYRISYLDDAPNNNHRIIVDVIVTRNYNDDSTFTLSEEGSLNDDFATSGEFTGVNRSVVKIDHPEVPTFGWFDFFFLQGGFGRNNQPVMQDSNNHWVIVTGKDGSAGDTETTIIKRSI